MLVVVSRFLILIQMSNANQNLQHRSNLGYGRVNDKAVSNLLDVNRWANKYNTDGDFDTEGFERIQQAIKCIVGVS